MLNSAIHTHDHYLENGEHVVTAEVKSKCVKDWLLRGWNDMAKAPGISMFFGAIMALSVYMVYFAYQSQPFMMFKVATFFIMLSPFLATGLYYTAMKLEQGEKPSLSNAIFSWRSNLTEIALFALALGIIVAIWGRIVPLIISFVTSDNLIIVDPALGVQGFLFSSTGVEFLSVFFVLSSVVSLFVFAISVVTIPMLLKDKNVGVISAMVLSWQVVMENKKIMAVWALTIGALLTVGIMSFGLGMFIVMPLLGYASWHAFNDLVEIDEDYPAINPS